MNLHPDDEADVTAFIAALTDPACWNPLAQCTRALADGDFSPSHIQRRMTGRPR